MRLVLGVLIVVLVIVVGLVGVVILLVVEGVEAVVLAVAGAALARPVSQPLSGMPGTSHCPEELGHGSVERVMPAV